MIQLINGDCVEEIKKLQENSVDAIVTDPPYHLVSIVKRFGKADSAPAKFGTDGAFARASKGFMGKQWDGLDENGIGIAQNVELWKECLRVLKPGGHLLAFSGTRTYHRMASAIEDAGFEVRDMIEWVYGSGFPKSLNVGKAVDKLQGNEREIIGEHPYANRGTAQSKQSVNLSGSPERSQFLDKGTSEWEGWGTALKPAHEPICMARKPLSEKTVAENCLKWGTGGINIEESKVGTEITKTTIKDFSQAHGNQFGKAGITYPTEGYKENTPGRFPANLLHDGSEEVRECFPETKSTPRTATMGGTGGIGVNTNFQRGSETSDYSDSGNASRFFKSIIYQAKASKSDRGQGNTHATVKPTALMEYLIKMVTKEGQTVLEPFMGSGTTGVACKNINRNFIGIELEKDYFEIAKRRIGD